MLIFRVHFKSKRVIKSRPCQLLAPGVLLPSVPCVFLQIPFGVFHIVLCEALGLVGPGVLDKPGRHAAPQLVCPHLGVLEHQGAGGHDRPLADVAVVEQGGAHADECAVADGAGVDGGVVPDGHVVADGGGAGGVGHVDARPVLHVGAVADGDGRHVAPHHGVEPDGAPVAHGDLANDGGVLAEVAVLAPFRGLALDRFD